VIAAELKMIET